jgi:sugar transferase EpsL
MAKRIFDIIVSAVLLLITAPLFLIVGAIVLGTLGRPMLYKQRRPGLHGDLFTIYKFRTMRHPLATGRDLFDEEQRLTRVGRTLRSSSLDELPELINVLRGDMSLVGPRPLLPVYLDRYSPEQARRHDVRPGITGWAQINGRNDISWESKFALDVYYVDHHSLRLDIKILLRTVGQVLLRRGITEQGETTSSEFMGAALKDAVSHRGPVDSPAAWRPVRELIDRTVIQLGQVQQPAFASSAERRTIATDESRDTTLAEPPFENVVAMKRWCDEHDR